MSNEIKIEVSSDYDPSGLRKAREDLGSLQAAARHAGKEVSDLDRQLKSLKDVKVKVKVETDGMPSNMAPGDQSYRIRPKIDDPSPAAAKTFVSRFADMAGSAMGPAMKVMGSHAGITAGVAAGVAAGPVMASALGSALSGAIGAGALGAGVAVAIAGDKQLQRAGKVMASNVFTAFKEEASVLKGPVRESFTVLEDAGGRIAGKWGDAFDELQGDLVPFVKDVVSGTERISDAFTNIAKGSGGEALAGLGDTWKLVADGVGDTLEILADGGPEAADNLRLVAGATGDLLRQTGSLLDMMNKAASNPFLTGPLIPELRQHYVEAAEASGTFARHTKGAADAMVEAERAALAETSALEDLAKELKAQADPVFAIVKAQDDLAAAQKDTAKATKEHGKDSAEAEAALQKQALAALSLEANVGKLGDTFTGKMTPAMRATLRAAKLSDEAIDRLEKQFRTAKRAGDQFSRTYRARATLDGFRNVNGQLTGLLRDLRNFDGVWTATMITNYKTFGKPGSGGGLAHGGIKGAANGGVRSDMTWVGEEGPELVNLAPGSRVHSNPDSMRMAAAGGGGQSGPITVNLVVDGRVLAQSTVEPLRGMVSRQASGSAQRFFGDPRVSA
jgi:hypothetical protein